MVWILPGSFMAGAAQMPRYFGAGLARQGVVVVTFNYRLGLLGQFAHPALTATQPDETLGNYALMDQVAALQWVQRNIAAFGGDPDNVTIFGMSAGGVSVNYLMTSPATKGLFHRAASQSSGIRVKAPRHIFDDVDGVRSLQNEGVVIAERLGVAGDEPNAAAALRALSVEQILDYQANNVIGSGGSLNPVVDGRLVVESVGAAFEAGRAHPLPYMAGATSWEGSLLTFLDKADMLLDRFRMTRQDADAIYGDADERTVIDNMEVDLFFGSQRYFVKHHGENGHPSWLYYFSRVLESQVGEVPGAAHGAETRYVLKTLDSLEGPAVMPAHGQKVSPSDHDYADLVSAYWVDFAQGGNPNGGDRPEWPAFTAEQDVLLDFAQDGPLVRDDFLKARMTFFEAHFDAGKM